MQSLEKKPDVLEEFQAANKGGGEEDAAAQEAAKRLAEADRANVGWEELELNADIAAIAMSHITQSPIALEGALQKLCGSLGVVFRDATGLGQLDSVLSHLVDATVNLHTGSGADVLVSVLDQLQLAMENFVHCTASLVPADPKARHAYRRLQSGVRTMIRQGKAAAQHIKDATQASSVDFTAAPPPPKKPDDEDEPDA